MAVRIYYLFEDSDGEVDEDKYEELIQTFDGLSNSEILEHPLFLKIFNKYIMSISS